MAEMRRSVGLHREPTLREGDAILDAIERELTALGADVARRPRTMLRFRMPPPWRTRRLNPLVAASGGAVSVDAGHAGPRRIRFALAFARLWIYALVVELIVLVVGLRWSRPTLLIVLGAVWLVAFAVPWLLGSWRFRRMVLGASRSVLDRAGRHAPS
jgi:hypothetical protein